MPDEGMGYYFAGTIYRKVWSTFNIQFPGQFRAIFVLT